MSLVLQSVSFNYYPSTTPINHIVLLAHMTRDGWFMCFCFWGHSVPPNEGHTICYLLHFIAEFHHSSLKQSLCLPHILPITTLTVYSVHTIPRVRLVLWVRLRASSKWCVTSLLYWSLSFSEFLPPSKSVIWEHCHTPNLTSSLSFLYLVFSFCAILFWTDVIARYEYPHIFKASLMISHSFAPSVSSNPILLHLWSILIIQVRDNLQCLHAHAAAIFRLSSHWWKVADQHLKIRRQKNRTICDTIKPSIMTKYQTDECL